MERKLEPAKENIIKVNQVKEDEMITEACQECPVAVEGQECSCERTDDKVVKVKLRRKEDEGMLNPA